MFEALRHGARTLDDLADSMIVMDEGGAMQKLNGCTRPFRQRPIVGPARSGHAHAKLGGQPRPAGKDRMAQGRRQFARAVLLNAGDGRLKRLLDPAQGVHAILRIFVNLI